MKALILVDIQNDYFTGGRMELSGMETASLKAKDLLTLFRKKNLPVFHIQHISVRKGATFFLPHTTGTEIHETVTPLSDETVIQKHYPNSFRETQLLEALHQAGIKQTVICGAMSHMCIDATARAAADLGFDCMIIHDACATKDLMFGNKKIAAEDVHGAFMAALGAAYAQVMSFSEFESRI